MRSIALSLVALFAIACDRPTYVSPPAVPIYEQPAPQVAPPDPPPAYAQAIPQASAMPVAVQMAPPPNPYGPTSCLFGVAVPPYPEWTGGGWIGHPGYCDRMHIGVVFHAGYYDSYRHSYVRPYWDPPVRETTIRRTTTSYRAEDKVGVRAAPVVPAATRVAPALQAPAPAVGGLRGAAQNVGGTFAVDNRPKPAATGFGAVPAPRPAPTPAPSYGTTATRPAAPAPRPAPSFSAPSRPSYGSTATRGKR